MAQLARKVLKNTAFSSSGVIISGIGGLIFTAVLARLLDPELFGIYYLALSVAFILMAFTDLGVNRTMIRYVSYALGKDNKTLARSFFRYLLKIKFLFAFVSSLAVIIFAKPLSIYLFHKPDLFFPLMIVGIFLFFFSFLDFVSGAFVALQKFQYPAARNVIYEVLRLTIVPSFIIFGYSVCGALIGLSLVVILTFAVLLFLLVRKYPYLFKGGTVKVEKRRILRFLGYLTFSTLVAGLFFHQIDILMLGILLTTEDVGFYTAAFNMVFAFMGLISATTVLFPVFTQLEGDELKNAFEKTFKYLSMFAFPCAFGLMFMANPVIKVVYGEEYLAAVTPFYVLCLLILIAPLNFFSTLFESKEKPKYPALVVVIASGLNVVLNYIFILKFGMIGAAIATLIARYFNNITLALLSKRILNIFPSSHVVYKPLFSSFAMSVFLYFMPDPATILDGVIEIISAAAIYISTMFLIKGIDKEDIKYFSAIVGQEERLMRAYDLMDDKLRRSER